MKTCIIDEGQSGFALTKDEHCIKISTEADRLILRDLSGRYPSAHFMPDGTLVVKYLLSPHAAVAAHREETAQHAVARDDASS